MAKKEGISGNEEMQGRKGRIIGSVHVEMKNFGAIASQSNVLSYIQFGQFVMIVMSVSWAYATFVFQAMCCILGPEKNSGQMMVPKHKTRYKRLKACLCCANDDLDHYKMVRKNDSTEVINAKRSSTLLKEEGEPSTSTEQGETSTMAEVYTDKGGPSTSTLADQDEPSTWPGPGGTEDTFVQAIDQVGSCKLFTTHDDSEDSDDDAGDDDSKNDSNDGDLLEPSSQTETEEEPMMVDKTVSSDTEPEDENVTYGKRCANYTCSFYVSQGWVI
ncbi:dispatched homolog 1 [Paramuricea clavata]|uniref:Dispatched homolog 1 n=1 Tax=Paramuricea clavata TaxID=317549 RepID=A0A7D9I460_PARCT|nr:dispatched homolog 1 [Paramuricea clavata]